jgi:2-octaprenyl-6-methoxyphenol hydroxylase
MLHDVVIVGAGPVGATLALALARDDLDVVALDARASGASLRRDRSLALSHAARLVFERLGVWSDLVAMPQAVTPILAIDVSERGGFGSARLDAAEQGLPALGYVASYRALQSALDVALTHAGVSVEHGLTATRVSATPSYACVEGKRDTAAASFTCRLAAVADGGSDMVAGIVRHRHDYGRVALVARVWTHEAHGGVAFERFTPEGPIALLPEGDHFGLVWTTSPQEGETLVALPEREFLETLTKRFGRHAGCFERVDERRSFPLVLEFVDRVVAERVVLLGNAAQALHPVAGQGLNLGIRDAWELAQELLAAPRDEIGAVDQLAAYAKRRRIDRWAGVAFTHGLLRVFGNDYALLRWPRGLALTLLDALPPLKRTFTRTMLFGLH